MESPLDTQQQYDMVKHLCVVVGAAWSTTEAGESSKHAITGYDGSAAIRAMANFRWLKRRTISTKNNFFCNISSGKIALLGTFATELQPLE